MVQDVYQITDILNEVELTSLSNIAETVVSQQYDDIHKITQAVKSKEISELFASILKALLKNEEPSYRNWAIAMYMEGILQFLNMKANQFSKGPKALPEMLPMALRHKIFATFTDDQRISPESKDRAVCYILVLALTCSKFVLDFSTVSTSIKAKKVPQ